MQEIRYVQCKCGKLAKRTIYEATFKLCKECYKKEFLSPGGEMPGVRNHRHAISRKAKASYLGRL